MIPQEESKNNAVNVSELQNNDIEEEKAPETFKDKVMAGVKKLKTLNAKFFVFEADELEQYEATREKKPKMKTVKLLLKIAIAVLLFIQIVYKNF